MGDVPLHEYQPSVAELRMLSVVAQQAIVDAWRCGMERAWFRGYRIEVRRLDGGHGRSQLLVLTLDSVDTAGALDRVLIEVAPRSNSVSACGISFSRASAVRPAVPSLSLAVSARLMRVKHRPNPVRSPENREPQGSEMLSVASTQSGSPIPALGVVSPFPCVPCP